jgi:ribosome-interacting GTPase 1
MAPFENVQFQLVDTPPITGEYVDPAMADMIRHADIIVILLDVSADLLGQYEETLATLEDFRIFPEGTQPPDEMKKTVFFKKMLVVANKTDTEKQEEDFDTFVDLVGPIMPALGISVHRGRNLDRFLRILYDLAGVIRVNSKNPGKEPDLEEPFVVPKDTTLEELAAKIHKDIAKKMKYARIWGTSVHDGQMVQRDYVLHDGDIVEIHI